MDAFDAAAPNPHHPAGPATEVAVEALLACLSMCHHPRQRRSLQDKVVVHSLHLADRTARRYRARGVDIEDLTQVARLALVKAVRGYQCGRGSGFTAYAIPTITGEIKRYFRDHGWAVRPPRRLQELTARVAVEETALRQRLHRDPTAQEVAAAAGVSPYALEEARVATRGYRTSSLDDGPPDASPLQVRDERDDIGDLITRMALHDAVSALPNRERDILRMRFVEDRTQSEISRELGVSQMQVSRLLVSILCKLRTSLTDADAAA